MTTDFFKYSNPIPGDFPIPLVMLTDTSGTPVNPGGGAAPVVRTPTLERVTVSGVVAAGAKSVSFAVNAGTLTINGADVYFYDPYPVVSFSPPDGDTLAAITYTLSVGADVSIAKVV